MSIKGSVGRGGVNRGEDVRAVQVLLNDWRSENALPAIAEDGLAGPETIRAITLFQQRVTRIIDGRVDPNGPAEKRLTSMYVASALKKAAALGLSLLREYDRFLTQKQVTLPISVGSRVNAFRSRLCGLAGSQPQSSGGPRFFNLGLDIVPAGDSIQVGAGIAIPIALVLLALAALTVALIKPLQELARLLIRAAVATADEITRFTLEIKNLSDQIIIKILVAITAIAKAIDECRRQLESQLVKPSPECLAALALCDQLLVRVRAKQAELLALISELERAARNPIAAQVLIAKALAAANELLELTKDLGQALAEAFLKCGCKIGTLVLV